MPVRVADAAGKHHEIEEPKAISRPPGNMLVDDAEKIGQLRAEHADDHVHVHEVRVDWLQAHLNWLATLRTAAIAIAILCVLVNLWRAFRFVQPVSRGRGQ